MTEKRLMVPGGKKAHVVDPKTDVPYVCYLYRPEYAPPEMDDCKRCRASKQAADRRAEIKATYDAIQPGDSFRAMGTQTHRAIGWQDEACAYWCSKLPVYPKWPPSGKAERNPTSGPKCKKCFPDRKPKPSRKPKPKRGKFEVGDQVTGSLSGEVLEIDGDLALVKSAFGALRVAKSGLVKA